MRTEIPVPPDRQKRRLVRIESLPLLLIGGFGLAILIGTVLLMLPVASEERSWTSPVIALFVATSAVCVTGLVPVDTATHWSGFGEVVILLLIQFGGLGFMTSATLLFLLFGWRVGIRERAFISQSLDLSRMGGVVSLTRRTITYALGLEALGFIILSARFSTDRPLDDALWSGLFHSVSAFNNAGFDVLGGFRSLQDNADFVTLATVSVLVIAGSTGYLIIENLRLRGMTMNLDTKVVLVTTALLLAGGLLAYLTLEWNNTLAGRTLPDKLLQSWFHSVTPRTAGFNSLAVDELNESTQFFTMGLMFVGGASGSTAGGIKVGTLAIIVAAAFSTVRGREQPEAAGREIRRSDVDRALTVALLGAALIFIGAIVLAQIHSFDFLPVLFETVSAFGTVGLSTGITPDLSDGGLLIVTAMMFAGRLGPLTLVLALVQRSRPSARRLPEDRVRIG